MIQYCRNVEERIKAGPAGRSGLRVPVRVMEVFRINYDAATRPMAARANHYGIKSATCR